VPEPRPRLPPYLVLLRVGFALPTALLPRRCALTAPFHPYLAAAVIPAPTGGGITAAAGRYVFCGTFRRTGLNPPSRTLSGTLLCGVRTFLPRHLTRRERPSGPAANNFIIVRADRACRVACSLTPWAREGTDITTGPGQSTMESDRRDKPARRAQSHAEAP